MPRRGFRRIKKDKPVEKRIRPNTWSQDAVGESDQRVTAIDKHNIAFVEYYKHQKIIPEEQWDTFYNTLKQPLPTTFRIVEGTVHTDYVLAVVKKAEAEFPNIVRRLEWYPGLAYEVNVSRAQLRSVDLLRGFHRFLVHQSEAGTIYRQEAVSMVPALFIPIQDHSRILDMCAAPGSKTSQLLERLHRFEGGVVIANDACSRRGHMLIHHLRHLDSPSLLVTNHSAQLFPNTFISETPDEVVRLQYTSILCDVPCSGDGTFRKSEIMWRDWDTVRSLGLHRLQLSILRRALELCEVGGIVVYSTCSFNPLENEAVVNAALASSPGSLELQDCEATLKDFPHSCGITEWGVFYKQQWYERFEDVSCQPKSRQAIVPTMFYGCRDDREDLRKCLRFFPHLSNTGGFFVAVIKKTSDLHWVRIAAPRTAEKTASPPASATETEQTTHSDQNKVDPGSEKRVTEECRNGLEECAKTDAQITMETSTENRTNGSTEDGAVDVLDDVCEEGLADIVKEETELSKISRCDSPKTVSTFFKCQTDFLSFEQLFKDDTTTDQLNALWAKLGQAYGFRCTANNMWQRLLVKAESRASPRRIWLTSREGAAIIHAQFRNPLRILWAGCNIFDGKHSNHFRLSSSGARWLTKEGWGPAGGLRNLESELVAVVEPELMLHLLREHETPPATVENEKSRQPGQEYRHRFEDLTAYEGCAALQKIPAERPCLLVFHLSDVHGDFPIPAWRGKTNVQILLDASTRYAITQLLLHAQGEPLLAVHEGTIPEFQTIEKIVNTP